MPTRAFDPREMLLSHMKLIKPSETYKYDADGKNIKGKHRHATGYPEGTEARQK